MSREIFPSEQTVFEALGLFLSPEFRKSSDPRQSELELAEDAASFALLDAIMDGREIPTPSIDNVAAAVVRLAADMKGK